MVCRTSCPLKLSHKEAVELRGALCSSTPPGEPRVEITRGAQGNRPGHFTLVRAQNSGTNAIRSLGKDPFQGSVIVLNFTFPLKSNTRYNPNIVRQSLSNAVLPLAIARRHALGMIRGIPDLVKPNVGPKALVSLRTSPALHFINAILQAFKYNDKPEGP